MRIRSALAVLATPLLVACATSFDNAPSNLPLTAASMASERPPRDIVGENIIALSLSGGGLRASAFALGVMQALERMPDGQDLFDDLTFISSVSGGSLTAAYIGLEGRAGLKSFRSRVLERDFEADLRLSLWLPANLMRLMAGGINDRSNLTKVLDRDVFGGATFADIYRRRKPDVWINATDLYNRTPFPFIPPVFNGLCSDLSRLRVSEAVAASMAVPLAFAPVVLKTYPEDCTSPMPAWVEQARAEGGSVTAGVVTTTARAVANYRNPQRMRYVKLADGGLTDNQGLASLLVARAVSGTAHGPFSEADAVRIRRMLFLVVDAGRPPSGDWALSPDGPSGVEIGLAAADAAIDSATRQSVTAFRQMLSDWRESIIGFRCSLPEVRVRLHLQAGKPWRCEDVEFEMAVVGFEHLPQEQAERMRNMPTRLSLSKADIDLAVAAGREATWSQSALRRYAQSRLPAGPTVLK